MSSLQWKKALVFLLLLLFFRPEVAAKTTEKVNLSVKISVCGDGVVEGREDCEGDDLAGQTCADLGYDGGELSCDIACSYDYSGCWEKAVIEQTETTATDSEVSESMLSPTGITTLSPTSTPKPKLPPLVSAFDFNGDGRISKDELSQAMERWLDLREQSFSRSNLLCDLNNDGYCNLQDWSILLYYIDR